MTMELSQLFSDRYIYLLMWGSVYGGLFICGVLLYLLFISTAIHQNPTSVKENSPPIRLSMKTAIEGPTVSTRRYPSNIQSPMVVSTKEGGRTPSYSPSAKIRPLSRSALFFGKWILDRSGNVKISPSSGRESPMRPQI